MFRGVLRSEDVTVLRAGVSDAGQRGLNLAVITVDGRGSMWDPTHPNPQ